MDEDYHFAAQFTADLIAMNHTDFIITSTFQEIAGTEVKHAFSTAHLLQNFSLKAASGVLIESVALCRKAWDNMRWVSI